jgi:hypothetical protein
MAISVMIVLEISIYSLQSIVGDNKTTRVSSKVK